MHDLDLYLFHEGRHFDVAQFLGVHPIAGGARVGVWAPHARAVTVRFDGNGWNEDDAPLTRVNDAGVWIGEVAGLGVGQRYKFRITTDHGSFDKADPCAFASEQAPATASIVTDLAHEWHDDAWMQQRAATQSFDAPWSIYELHLGSWMRHWGHHLSYAELGERIADYVIALGFTHVEMLPIMEHPFEGSWGYQTTGYFAPTARFGDPHSCMAMIDHFHQRGIGVILDWVPAHFPADEFALARFDGTPLFEDPSLGRHPDWDTLQFDYGRPEVRSFLISSARFWLDHYHVDGLRFDAVASMLYLDYSREPGTWRPNQYGGRENLEAIRFLRECNDEIHRSHPDVRTIAEESTSWPMVSSPTEAGGLGFDAKWDMGWMHDTLHYLEREPIHRRFHHFELTFRSVYSTSERFVLPLSHDEVVHGKGSLLRKMPGDEWQRFANLRLLFGWQFAQTGKKLIFMGSELATGAEWDHDGQIDWGLADQPRHVGVRRWITDLNGLYRGEPAMHRGDGRDDGLSWVIGDDADQSVFAFMRNAPDARPVLVVTNATPEVRTNYRIGVPTSGPWLELLNSDATVYGGSGAGNFGVIESNPLPSHGMDASLTLTLPPLSTLFLAPASP